MLELPALRTMNSEDKDALIYDLWDRNKALEAELEKYKKRIRKTSKNSSVPPSKDPKKNVQSQSTSSTKSSHKKHHSGGRPLSPEPDQIVVAYAQECCHCHCCLNPEQQQLEAHYDKIELPPIRPIITQVKRYGGLCPECGQYYVAAVPCALESGSPFGDSITAVVGYLRYAHAISYQRMKQLLAQIFNLEISQGALANLFARFHQKLQPSLSEILEKLREAQSIGSDETSARVNGKTEWEWVFQNESVSYHVIRPTRGAKVIDEVMADHEPEAWISDLFSAQAKHPAKKWQVCLAHQLRDCQYAIDKGDQIFAPVMHRLFLKAIAIHRRRDKLAASTLKKYCQQVKSQLKHALSLNPEQADGKRLLKRYQKIEAHLFLFLDDPSIPPTNNASEQALRMSVIFRKVTNGFRSEWGKEAFAAVRSVVNTGMRQGLSAFEAIQKALDPDTQFFFPG